ncbi:MAG TPA: hypothetical protein VK811_07535 [Candidatus Acidoferrum sp.]|nr:hypothetical protein [Candidatus Acidoferrum sp.]
MLELVRNRWFAALIFGQNGFSFWSLGSIHMPNPTNITQWIIPALLIFIFVVFAIINPILVVRREILKRKNAPSLLPFIGGLIGVFGFLLAPHHVLLRQAWIPLLADFGSLPWLIYVFWAVHRERRNRKQPTTQ